MKPSSFGTAVPVAQMIPGPVPPSTLRVVPPPMSTQWHQQPCRAVCTNHALISSVQTGMLSPYFPGPHQRVPVGSYVCTRALAEAERNKEKIASMGRELRSAKEALHALIQSSSAENKKCIEFGSKKMHVMCEKTLATIQVEIRRAQEAQRSNVCNFSKELKELQSAIEKMEMQLPQKIAEALHKTGVVALENQNKEKLTTPVTPTAMVVPAVSVAASSPLSMCSKCTRKNRQDKRFVWPAVVGFAQELTNKQQDQHTKQAVSQSPEICEASRFQEEACSTLICND
jgi:hypothetical protein